MKTALHVVLIAVAALAFALPYLRITTQMGNQPTSGSPARLGAFFAPKMIAISKSGISLSG